jgi:pimeloyl-ACP methyl ester carboxylesterase
MDEVLQLTPAQKRKRRIVKTIQHIIFAAFAYGSLVVAARLVHRRVVYQPPDGEPAALPQGATLLTATAADGVAVHAIELAPAKPAARTIVHFHGNAETADDNLKLGHELEKKGFDVVLVEYRGYGRSKGTSPTEQGLYLDAVAILDALEARGTPRDRIVLWGQSLGTGVAAEMARRGRGVRLVLVAPLASTLELARHAVPIPILPLDWVMVDRFDTLGKAPEITTPTLVVHGTADDVIPVQEGEEISKALPHATLLEVPEGKHTNLYKSASTVDAMVAHAGG